MKKILNIQGTLERIDHDESRLKELYTIALQEFPKWKDRLKKAIDEGSIEAIQKAAHSYKGSSATLGAEVCNEMFLAIENAAKEQDMQKINTLYSESFDANMQELEKEIKEYIQGGN